jgi:hypothetical protein
MLIFSFHLYLGLSSGLFLYNYLTQILYEFLLSQVQNCLLGCTAVWYNCRPTFQRYVLPPSQKTILNVILAAVRTWNLTFFCLPCVQNLPLISSSTTLSPYSDFYLYTYLCSIIVHVGYNCFPCCEAYFTRLAGLSTSSQCERWV